MFGEFGIVLSTPSFVIGASHKLTGSPFLPPMTSPNGKKKHTSASPFAIIAAS